METKTVQQLTTEINQTKEKILLELSEIESARNEVQKAGGSADKVVNQVRELVENLYHYTNTTEKTSKTLQTFIEKSAEESKTNFNSNAKEQLAFFKSAFEQETKELLKAKSAIERYYDSVEKHIGKSAELQKKLEKINFSDEFRSNQKILDIIKKTVENVERNANTVDYSISNLKSEIQISQKQSKTGFEDLKYALSESDKLLKSNQGENNKSFANIDSCLKEIEKSNKKSFEQTHSNLEKLSQVNEDELTKINSEISKSSNSNIERIEKLEERIIELQSSQTNYIFTVLGFVGLNIILSIIFFVLR